MMTKNFFKAQLTCFAILATTALPAIAQDNEHSDGEAAIYGQAMLDYWRNGPTVQGTIERVTRTKSDTAIRLGVAPGEYSVGDMAQISAAKSHKHRSAHDVTMMKINGVRPMKKNHVSQGERSLAASAGVSAQDYSLNELARMKFAADF